MQKEEKVVHETGVEYRIKSGEKDTVHLQMEVPLALWERFLHWAEIQKLSVSDALLSLIRRQVSLPVSPDTVSGFYADLTRQHLEGELKRTGSILDFRLDEQTAAAIVESLCREYGTDNPVEIISLMRQRT